MLCEDCGTACECEAGDTKEFPNAPKMRQAHGLDLAGSTSSPELTRDYVAEYCRLNHLKA